MEASGIAIASVDVKKLKDASLCPIVSVAFPPTKDLLQTKGISEAHVDNTIEAASKLLSLRFITASQLLAQRIETSKLLPMGFVTASQLLAQRIETSKLVPMGFITASQLLAQRIETSNLVPMGFITASRLLAQRIETSKLVPMGFVTASQLLAQRLENVQITSESRELDNISEGGNETRSTTQIYGDICSASSQSYHPLCGTCQASGIASIDVKKLTDGGPCSVESVAFTPRKDLLQIKGIREAKVDKTIEAASKLFLLGSSSASQGLENIHITSESRELDKILEGGGINTESITEIYSEICSGKTGSITEVKTLVNLTANKSWNMAIRNPYFVKEYDKRGCGRTDIVLVQEQTRWDFSLYNLRTHTWNERKEFPRGTFEWDQFDIAGSCGGLLCLTVLNVVDAPIYMWNPSLMKIRALPLPQGHNQVENGMENAAFGLGMNRKTHEYQLVRILCVTPHEVKNPQYKVHVFDLSSNAWNTLHQMLGDDEPLHFWSPYGVYLDGCIHWAMQHKLKREILSYDMVNQSFQILPPFPEENNTTNWSAGVCNEVLGLFMHRDFLPPGVLSHCMVYNLIEMAIWDGYYRIMHDSQLAIARPLSHTEYGYNTAVLNLKTEEFHFSLFVGSNNLLGLDERTSDIVVMPGEDGGFFVDEYRDTLQLLL
ncbi:hypothetical protein ACLB2K_003660 [Fragaria x ananassa]